MDGLLRIDKTAISVGSLDDRDDEKEYWLKKSPQERIAALELYRRMVYGEHNVTSRLQRILEVIELEER